MRPRHDRRRRSTSPSRTDPPGAMIAAHPPATAASKPSAKGKKPSLAHAAPLAWPPARCDAICTALTRFVWPAQMPRVVPPLTITMPLLFTCRTTSQANARSCHCCGLWLAPADDAPLFRPALPDRRLRRERRRARFAGAVRAPARRERRHEAHDAKVLLFLEQVERIRIEGRRRDDLEKELAERLAPLRASIGASAATIPPNAETGSASSASRTAKPTCERCATPQGTVCLTTAARTNRCAVAAELRTERRAREQPQRGVEVE